MRYAALIFSLFASLFAATSAASAQQGTPQLTWRGYISGSATLYIQGDRVDVQGRSTGDVDRPDYRFTTPLPAAGRQQVSATVRRGRGNVRVVEQPVPGNEYTAVVVVDAPGQRHEYYTIDFYWDAFRERSRNDRYSQRNGRYEDEDEGYRDDDRRNRDRDGRQTRGRSAGTQDSGEIHWSGRVDNEAVVQVRGRQISSRSVRGRSITGERVNYTSPMPREAVNVHLEDVQGRGQVEIIDQPSASNGYAAVVRIRDTESGAGDYSFRLAWERDGFDADDDRDDGYRSRTSGGILTPNDPGRQGPYDGAYSSGTGSDVSSGTARWSGRVDGTVRITMQGRRATTLVVSGRPATGISADFGTAIPYDVQDINIRKQSGRGQVELVQRPSRSNNGALAFEIRDDDGGPDYYEVEISWR